MLGSLGFPEIFFIFVIALLLFGPRRMPKMIRTIGRTVGEIKRASNDFKRTIEQEIVDEDLRETGRELRSAIAEGRSILNGDSRSERPPGAQPTRQVDPGPAAADQASGDHAPAGQAPAGHAPAGQAPAGQAPAGHAPAGQAPAGHTDANQAPAGHTDANQAPPGQAAPDQERTP